MSKRAIAIILSVLVPAGTCIALIFFFARNYYPTPTNDEFDLEVGETITIKINSNSSTGYEQCWINENKCRAVKIVQQHYSSIWEMFGGIGAGGTVALTFEAINAGQDTVKISDCPTLRMYKDCSYFSGDSLRLDDVDSMVSRFDPYRKGDYNFVFTVVE